MTLPLTLIVITGEIDLSVASILGLASAMLGYLVKHGWPMWRCFVVVILLGAAAGLFNGLLITRLGLPVARRHDRDADALPRARRGHPRPEHRLELPRAVHEHRRQRLRRDASSPGRSAFFLVLAVVFGVVLHLTPLGRSLFVMGANKDAALYAGLPRQADQAAAVRLSGRHLRVRGNPLHLPALDRRPGQRSRARTERRRDRPARRRVDLRRQGLDHRRRSRRVRLRGAPERALPHELPATRVRDRHRLPASDQRPRPQRRLLRAARARGAAPTRSSRGAPSRGVQLMPSALAGAERPAPGRRWSEA